MCSFSFIIDFISRITKSTGLNLLFFLWVMQWDNEATPPINITVVHNFKNQGLFIFPSVQVTVSYYYNWSLNQVESDVERWRPISNCFQACASIIKMNILPCVNICSAMLPLPPPADHWDKLLNLVSKYVWKGKCPQIKMSILQRQKLLGGLGFPNFKSYFWFLSHRAFYTWLNPDTQAAWFFHWKKRW